MKRINDKNINTKEYLDDLYAKPGYLGNGYDDARRRLKLIVDNLPKKKRHFDVGCADGTFTKYYLEKYPDTYGFGMDISTEAIKLAKANCPDAIFTTQWINGMDLIHCGEVLEHIEIPSLFIEEIYSCLNPGGLLVLTTPNEMASPYEEHLWNWNIEDIKDLLGKFKIIKEDPKFFNGSLIYIEAVK